MSGTFHCRSCQADIIFARTVKGHRIPVDPKPVTNGKGNLRLEPQEGDLPIAVMVAPGEGTHLSHFATCTDPGAHRRR